MDKAKPFCISKREVWETYKQVKANHGTAGIDKETRDSFEKNLSNNLYKVWNRMSSGSYFPQPVRRVEIPKGDGRTRPLGIPTVADRIAQTVAKRYLEPLVEPMFHKDSYGYRPGRSAHQALAAARQRCWKYDWVLDLDIRAFFESIDHALLLHVVRHHTDCPWVLLYIERWLKAPIVMSGGTSEDRTKGTAQGSVISPLLANLFLHYAFDHWMKAHYPQVPFERYADDVICHCRSETQAQMLKVEITKRLAACRLELHPEKTKIVYCMDSNRRRRYPNRKFDFLGYTFRPRQSMNRDGRLFVSFAPAVSDRAAKAMRKRIRRWKIHHHNDLELKDIAFWARPVLEGWVRYYGRFYGSALRDALHTLDVFLVRWALRKYKRFRGHTMRLWDWYRGIKAREPKLFPHWIPEATAGR